MKIERSLTAAIALALALGLGLAGCTTQAPAEPAGQTESGGDDQTVETGTALTKDDFAERITAAQLQAGMVHVSQTIETDGSTTTTDGAMTVTADIGSARVAMTSSGPTGSNEVRIVDGVMYMNLGELSQNMFMVIDGSDSALMDPTEIMRLLDPQTQIDTFGRSILELTPGEREEIDGVSTTRYTLVLDTAILLSASPIPGIDPAVVGETVDYEIWVGDDDLPRRMSMSFAGTASSTTAVTDYSRWGEPVDIQAPSADQIIALG